MNEPNISIGLLTEKEIRFELYGDFTTAGSTKKFSGKYEAVLNGNKVVIKQNNSEIFSVTEISFTPNELETESFLIKNVVIGKNFHWEKKEDQRFRGTLQFIIEKENITAVNIIPLEEYLISVISSEMSPNSSLELLKAHAIVSRGWLLAQLETKKEKKRQKSLNEIINENEIIRWYDQEDHENYFFCADDHCQRYQGVTKIVNENAFNAIDRTKGMALTYDNKICDTRYSKCCGGMTESFENVWEPVKHNYLSPLVDYKFELDGLDYDLTKNKYAEKWINSNPHAYCNTTDQKILSQILVDFDRPTDNFFRWHVEYDQNKLTEIIYSKSGLDFGNIIDLIPIERGYSARIHKLKIVGTKQSKIIGKELEIRKTLSTSHLYSSAFYVVSLQIENNIPQKFILKGAGWGHGVGLCQIGAAVMGEKGYGFDEILSHYFKGAKIQKLY